MYSDYDYDQMNIDDEADYLQLEEERKHEEQEKLKREVFTKLLAEAKKYNIGHTFSEITQTDDLRKLLEKNREFRDFTLLKDCDIHFYYNPHVKKMIIRTYRLKESGNTFEKKKIHYILLNIQRNDIGDEMVTRNCVNRDVHKALCVPKSDNDLKNNLITRNCNVIRYENACRNANIVTKIHDPIFGGQDISTTKLCEWREQSYNLILGTEHNEKEYDGLFILKNVKHKNNDWQLDPRSSFKIKDPFSGDFVDQSRFQNFQNNNNLTFTGSWKNLEPLVYAEYIKLPHNCLNILERSDINHIVFDKINEKLVLKSVQGRDWLSINNKRSTLQLEHIFKEVKCKNFGRYDDGSNFFSLLDNCILGKSVDECVDHVVKDTNYLLLLTTILYIDRHIKGSEEPVGKKLYFLLEAKFLNANDYLNKKKYSNYNRLEFIAIWPQLIHVTDNDAVGYMKRCKGFKGFKRLRKFFGSIFSGGKSKKIRPKKITPKKNISIKNKSRKDKYRKNKSRKNT